MKKMDLFGLLLVAGAFSNCSADDLDVQATLEDVKVQVEAVECACAPECNCTKEIPCDACVAPVAGEAKSSTCDCAPNCECTECDECRKSA